MTKTYIKITKIRAGIKLIKKLYRQIHKNIIIIKHKKTK